MDENIFERYEKKYLLTKAQYKALMERLQDDLGTNQYSFSTVCSLYLDNDQSTLIRNSIDAIGYKEKYRLRSYGVPSDTSMVFLEVKKKYNGIVYKRRVAMTYKQAMAYLNQHKMPNQTQIMKEIDYGMSHYDYIEPKVLIMYDRSAYFLKSDPEIRITFDQNPRYRLDDLNMQDGMDGESILSQDQVLLELKNPGYLPLWLAQILDELKIYPTSFSKYGAVYNNRIRGNDSYEHLYSN